jgi:Asp-tRNA(Asn)/Glu-tRNA(Gln) amidotransferase A subunit family amidase
MIVASVNELSRNAFIKSLLVAAASTALPNIGEPAPAPEETITLDDLRAMEKIAGIHFTEEERTQVLMQVQDARRGYEAVRDQPIDFTIEPRTVFTTLAGGSLPFSKVSARPSSGSATRGTDEDVAFASTADLGRLIRSKQISSTELTKLYLSRLEKYSPRLLNVVTLVPDLAMEQAKAADEEIAAGKYRGPLHGIPFGVKDLFSVRGIPSTWGAEPYETQIFDFDCTVVNRLRAAGAVLVAKLSMGALAMGDHWFKGRTANPWNVEEGSSGSSAGSASATAAGLIGFSIGTETLGSIVSPSIRCRVTGLRPTYGRVSRYGAMALSYTMDKVGPICRRAEDCALVLAAICGSDSFDPSAVDRPFKWPQRIEWTKLKVGYLVAGEKAAVPSDDPILKLLDRRGVKIRPVHFSPVPEGVGMILDVESASAFDRFTRGEEIHQLKNSSWPETFRAARYVPAVEYLQAQRARSLLMHRFESEFGDLDMFVCARGGSTLAHTNLTGHPQIVIPLQNGNAHSLVGRLFKEDQLTAVAHELQEELGFYKLRPDLSKVG